MRGKSCDAAFFGDAGSAKDRAQELNKYFADPSIKGIFSALGGDAAIQILSHLDYKLIRKNPKVFMGFSDVTTLLLPLYKMSGLQGFYGPNVKDIARQNARAQNFMFDIVTNSKEGAKYPVSSKNVFRSGSARGKLLGGNLFVINSLAATKFLPSFKNAILFFEDIDEDLAAFEYQINLLKLTGILDVISGLVIGNISGRKVNTRSVKEIVLELTKNSSYPILKCDFFGHGIQNFLPLQLGQMANIEATNNIVRFSTEQ